MGERAVKLLGSTVTSTAVEYLTYASDYSGSPSCVDRSLSVEPAQSFTIVTVEGDVDLSQREASVIHGQVSFVRTITSRY